MCTRITVPYFDKDKNVHFMVGRTMDFGSKVGMDYYHIQAGSKQSSYFDPVTGKVVAGTTDIYGRAKTVTIEIPLIFKKDILFLSDAANRYFSVEGLWLPETKYKSREKEWPDQGHLDALSLMKYVLGGTLKTLADVKKAIDGKVVSLPAAKAIEFLATIHLAVTEWATGKTLIIEIGTGADVGVAKVYEDTGRGVMTNSPVYPSQVNNLRNYIGLTNTANTMNAKVAGLDLHITGFGNNLVGLPGDPLPASRFVKANILLELALRHQGAEATVDGVKLMVLPSFEAARSLLAEILAQVSVIAGTSSEPKDAGLEREWDATIWSVLKTSAGDVPQYLVRYDPSLGFAAETPTLTTEPFDGE